MVLAYRLALAAIIACLVLVSPVYARYCNNPYCAMCNRLFGTMYATPVAVRTPTKIDSTPSGVVDAMLREVSPAADDLLYDPGCGDGRILEAAIRDYGCRAVGIEIDAGVASSARARLSTAFRVPRSLWRITTGDATRYDLSHATVACLYLFPETLSKVVPRLTGCTRLVSYSHPIPGEPNRKVETPKGPIYVVDRRSSVTPVEVKWLPFGAPLPIRTKWREWSPAVFLPQPAEPIAQSGPQMKAKPKRQVIVKPIIVCRT